MTIEARNPKRNIDGTIDLEYYHPVHGWLGFTATATDREPIGRQLFAMAEDGAFGKIAPADPPREIPIGYVKKMAVAAINEACRSEIIKGFSSSALGEPHHYPFDEHDQANLTATFVLAKELGSPRPFKCRDMAGTWEYRQHTVAQLVQVGKDAEIHKMTALAKAHTLKQQIEAATTAEAVKAITW